MIQWNAVGQRESCPSGGAPYGKTSTSFISIEGICFNMNETFPVSLNATSYSMLHVCMNVHCPLSLH